MASIRNLRRKCGSSFGWSWDLDGVFYTTNADGEGLWKECIIGQMAYGDGRTGAAAGMKQIAGTCQYSMRGCNTYGSAYSHIRRWFAE